MRRHLRPLPRGPHALTREQVEQSQRERLFMAMIRSVAEKGYAQTSVADVLAASGVSRATFYALFNDKEDCFRAAYQRAAEQLAASLASGLQAMPAKRDPVAALEHVVELYLEVLASQPALARAFLVEVYAAGPRAIEQRQASLEAFVDLAALALHGETGQFGSAAEQRFAVKTLVHGVSSMVTGLVGVGQAEKLPGLRAPLIKLVKDLLRKK